MTPTNRRERPRSIIVDALWGSRWGFLGAVFYSLLACALFALHGGDRHREEGLTLPVIIAGYLVGGTVAGCIVGFLRPLTKSRIGAAVVGVIALFPMCWGFGILAHGPLSSWGAAEYFGWTVTPILIGAFGGWEFHQLWADAAIPRA